MARGREVTDGSERRDEKKAADESSRESDSAGDESDHTILLFSIDPFFNSIPLLPNHGQII